MLRHSSMSFQTLFLLASKEALRVEGGIKIVAIDNVTGQK